MPLKYQYWQGLGRRCPITRLATTTVSGNEITDSVRLAALSGDGLPVDGSGIGMWPTSTNRTTNGNATTNTTGIVDNSSTTTRATTGTVKFGTTCFNVVSSNALANEGPYQAISGGAASTQYSCNAWVWLVSGAATVRAVIYDSVSGKQGGTPVVLTTTPQKITVTATTGAASTNQRSYIETTVQQAGTWRIGGWETSALSIPDPYIATDGGTAVRNAGRIQFTVGTLLAASQGWIAIRPKIMAPSTTGGRLRVFNWLTGNNYNIGYYEPSDDTWKMARDNNSGVADIHSSAAQTWSLGDTKTVILAWTSGFLRSSIDGGAFTQTASTKTGTPPASSDLLGSGATTEQMYGQTYWICMGTGTLTDANASWLHGHGNNVPRPENFPTGMGLSAIMGGDPARLKTI